MLLSQMIVMGLIVGSLFYNVPANRTGVRTLLGASFICLMFLAFGSAPELGLLLMNRRWVVPVQVVCRCAFKAQAGPSRFRPSLVLALKHKAEHSCAL
jgi:hypothetical protein